jgi:WD domain, G-beta repeat
MRSPSLGCLWGKRYTGPASTSGFASCSRTPLTRRKCAEAPAVKAVDRWDQLEKTAKVLSVIAIAVVLAIVGWLIQSSLSERNVSQEYVKLAVSILKEPKDKTEPALRGWGADLLNQKAPTKFSPQVLQALKERQATLPTQLPAILGATAGGASLAVGPDGKLFATGHSDGTAHLWDAASGKSVMMWHGHSAPVTSIAFSPDAHRLLTGSLDGTVRLWDLATGRELRRLVGHTDSVIGAAFAPNNRLQGDAFQRPLVPRSRFQARLNRGVGRQAITPCTR